MLDDTLVIWGGEFGRTVYSQGKLTKDNYGRDHHPRCFTMWMAGGGVKPGIVHGETDDFGYNITEDPVHVHDLHATILHLLGIDHTRLTYFHQGRHFRLTDVAGGNGEKHHRLTRFHPRHAWKKKAAANRNMNSEKNCPLVRNPTIAASGSRNCSPMIRNTA